MSTPALPERCPSCAGPLLADHPGGLVIQHDLACELLAREDATRAADHQRLDGGWWPIERPATATERRLLAVEADDGLTVTVQHVTQGVLNRTFTTTTEETP